MIPCRAVDSTGIKAEGEDALSAACFACACQIINGTPVSIPLTHASMCCRAAGGPKRRFWRKIHIGIDEETLEIRAVEVTSSIGPSRQIALQSPAGQWTHPCYLNCSIRSRRTKRLAVSPGTALTIPENAMMRLLHVMPMLSSRRARTPDCGSPTRPEPERETKLLDPQSTLVAHCGSKSPDTTAEAEAVSKQNLSSFASKRLPVSGCIL
jgi:hypothetical protein